MFSSTPLDMNDHQAYLSLVSDILSSGLPYYHSMRIPLPSVFNWDYLQKHIDSYHDGRLIDYLKFGFPLGLSYRDQIRSNVMLLTMITRTILMHSCVKNLRKGHYLDMGPFND